MELDNTMKPVNYDEEEDELSTMLPAEMVEYIISMMPYPDILKAKELSKEWNSKLSNTRDAENEGFRQMVYSNCRKWPIFFPCAFVNGSISLTGFDRQTGTWLKTSFHFPSLVTRKILVPNWLSNWLDPQQQELAEKVTGMDSLICSPVDSDHTEIFVLNICTGNWKWLPPRPKVNYTYYECESGVCKRFDMFLDGSDYYKVLTMRVRGRNGWKHLICTQLYESKSDSWTTNLSDFTTSSSPLQSKGVYMKGSMYFISHDFSTGFFEVWAYDIEKVTWQKMPVPRLSSSTLPTIESVDLIVSRDRLILVAPRIIPSLEEVTRPTIWRDSLSLFDIEIPTETFTEVYRGPPEPIYGASAKSYVCDGDSIFFRDGRNYSKFVMEFNICHQVWISHPHPSSSDGFVSFLSSNFVLQPGKNPFIVV